MRVRWVESMSLGIEQIDRQHRQLVQLLNALLAAVEQGHMEAARTAALEFQELALRHLDDEEAVFPEGYDGSRHLKGHREARALIETLRETVCGSDAADREATEDQLRAVLPAIVMELFNNDAGLARSLRD